MLDEAIRVVFRDARNACYCEWEAYAAAVLMARMEEKSLEHAPIWCGDIGLLDAKPFRGLVDILAGGLPCQPYSLAGNQDGNIDHRSWGKGDGPIPHALRLISECLPSVVFLENVPAWIRSPQRWFQPFGEELSRMGYTLCEPLYLRAANVGAGHDRERAFVLAYAPSARVWRLDKGSWLSGQGAFEPDGAGGPMANAGNGQLPVQGRGEGRRDGARPAGEVLADPGHTERRASDAQDGAGGQRASEPGGRGAELVDTEGGGSRRRLDQEGPEHNGTGPRGAGRAMVDTQGRGRGELRQSSRPEGRGQPDGTDPALAHTDGNGLGAGRRERPVYTEGKDDAPLANQHVADPGSEGLSERGDGRRIWELPAAQRGGAQVFAPGPGARREWAEIVRHSPHLAPAIKPGLCVLADGLAYTVDASRTDQLRCTGNGVVALQAAVALVVLLRRAKLLEIC